MVVSLLLSQMTNVRVRLGDKYTVTRYALEATQKVTLSTRLSSTKLCGDSGGNVCPQIEVETRGAKNATSRPVRITYIFLSAALACQIDFFCPVAGRREGDNRVLSVQRLSRHKAGNIMPHVSTFDN